MNHFLTTALVASSLALATTAHAQLSVSAGPKLGVNLSTLHVDGGSDNPAYRFGVAAGAQASLGWQKFALQPALLFSQKGCSVSEDISFSTPNGTLQSGTYTRKLRLNYLTLPLNFAFTPAGASTGPQFFAGPYVGVLLGGNIVQTYPPDASSTTSVYVVGNGDLPTGPGYYANRFDAGLQAGVGFRFEHLLLQAEYSLSLRNQYPAYTNTAIPTPTEYNRSFQASVSYLFDLTH